MHGILSMLPDATFVGLPSHRKRLPIALGCLPAALLCLTGMPQAARASVFQVGSDGTFVLSPVNRGGVLAIGAQGADDDAAAAEELPDVPTTALTTIDAPTVPTAYRASLTHAADTARVSPTLLAALVWQESRWRPAALSPKGARGLTQLMPATARALAVDPADDAANLAGGARYLRHMLDMFDGDVERALAAYNAGPGRVLRSGTALPAITETRSYVSAIIDRLGNGMAAPPGGMK